MPRLQQAFALARLLPQPGALQAFRSWKPFSITAFQMLRDLCRLGLRPKTVIDVGANIGQFARAAAETFPEARVVAFEPLPEVAQQARQHLADCPR
ncbi:MAG: FkbM family methyltransferase, partial [Bacteroidota bacterium]